MAFIDLDITDFIVDNHPDRSPISRHAGQLEFFAPHVSRTRTASFARLCRRYFVLNTGQLLSHNSVLGFHLTPLE